MKIKLAVVWISLIMIIACKQGNVKHGTIKATIDNPTKEAITVTVNDYTYDVKSKTSLPVLFAEGDNTITYGDTTVIYSMEKNAEHPQLLINPTQAVYVLEQITYARPDLKGEEISDLIPYDTIKIMNTLDVSGHYKQMNDFIIKKTWDYGINQKYPNTITKKDRNNKLYFIKIYREKDFFMKILKQQ
jgi:hypothetical protein